MPDASQDPDLPLPVVPRVTVSGPRLVLRLPTWLGDVVMAAPAVAALRAAHPDRELVAAVRPGLEGLARLLPGIDRTVQVGRERGLAGVRRAARVYEELDADACVVFPRGARAMLAPRWAGIPVRLGFGGGLQRRLLTHAVEDWRPWRAVHRSRWFSLLARAFGREIPETVELDPPPAAREAARALLGRLGRRGGRPLVVLEPGASYGAAKCWPTARFAALAKALGRAGAEVAVVGGPATAPLEADIVRESGVPVLRAVGATPDLGVLAALLAEADLVVANDTGPMHIAAAVGAPLLALFGATDPRISGPLGTGPRRLLWRPAPCSPCFLRTCVVDGHPCLSALGVGEVEREARRMLAGRGR